MPTLEEARKCQEETQRKSLTKFALSLLLYVAICVVLYFVDIRATYVGIVVCFFAMTHTVRRTRIYEIFKAKEFTGKVTYFSVRTESVKKNYSNQAGQTYGTNDFVYADIAVTDKNGRTRYKTFTHAPEYDRVKNGDKATILRFVDRPIVEIVDE